MKTSCETAQRQLLALADTGRPPPGVQAHLDDCSTCRDWQKRVALVDRAVQHLAVPTSSVKSALLRQLRSEPSRRQRLQWKAWQLTAAWSTVAVLLFFLLYNLAHTPGPTPRPPVVQNVNDPWLDKLLEKHQALAQAAKARQQIEGLADLADDVRDQTQVMLRFLDARELRELANLYGQAIQAGVTRAGDLPKTERRQVLEPIVQQLEKARVAAERQVKESRVASADHPLFIIASAAQRGKLQLDGLLQADVRLRGFSSGPCLAMLPRWTLTALPRTAQADDQAKALPSVDAIQQFQRNRKLVEALLASSIELVGNSERLARAGACNPLVARLADEVIAAANQKDSLRVAELCRQLRNLLTEGVAHNLSQGGVKALPGSEREQQLLRISGETLRLLDGLTAHVKDPTYRTALAAVQVGRKEVEIAVQGRGAKR